MVVAPGCRVQLGVVRNNLLVSQAYRTLLPQLPVELGGQSPDCLTSGLSVTASGDAECLLICEFMVLLIYYVTALQQSYGNGVGGGFQPIQRVFPHVALNQRSSETHFEIQYAILL